MNTFHKLNKLIYTLKLFIIRDNLEGTNIF